MKDQEAKAAKAKKERKPTKAAQLTAMNATPKLENVWNAGMDTFSMRNRFVNSKHARRISA